MGSERAGGTGFLFAVLVRALLLAALLCVLIYLFGYTRYYASMLVVVLAGALVVADLSVFVSRQNRATERFMEALSAGALETPMQRSAIPLALRETYDRLLVALRRDRRHQQQQSHHLQTLLDTVPAGLLVVSEEGALTVVNRAGHRLLGEGAARLTDLPALSAAAAAQLESLAPGTHRIVQLVSGRRLLASAARFATPGDRPRRLISLQRLTGDLDAVELTAWDDMARVLAHEMMNSLTPIASLAQSLDVLLRDGGRMEEVAEALETISRRSQGLLRFVERYRKVADLPEPQIRALPLAPLLEGVERLIRPALEERGITLVARVSPTELVIRADADLLEQALINLLRNAAEAAADVSQPHIDIDCRIENEQCIIEVRDNGLGISPGQRAQIFVPFYTTKPGGSGIGLALARRIAQGHGGRITVNSEESQGSVFRVSLPL